MLNPRRSPILCCARFFSWGRGRRIEVKRGKTAVLITGCDSGLGYSFARHCKDSLGVVVIACCLNPKTDGGAQLVSDYCKGGLHVVKLDLLNSHSIEDMRQQVVELTAKHGYEIHAVVNNAGVMTMGEFEWITTEQMLEMVTVNLLGPMSVTKHMLPFLRQTRGRVLNISSHCSLASMPGLSVYGATKSALEAWSTALRMEIRKFSIDVVTLIPGSYVTESQLLKGIAAKKDQMWSSLHPEAQTVHEKNFNEFYAHLNRIPVPQLNYIQDQRLFDQFDRALLDQSPRRTYVHGPLRYRFYFLLFSLSPTVRIREYLIKKFVNLPGY